jgi:hypothetical protein
MLTRVSGVWRLKMQHDARGLLLATGLLLCIDALCMPSAGAQRIAPAGSGQVAPVRQNANAGAIARSPGGQRTGTGSFAISEGTARVVSGRVAGYGARAYTGLGEYIGGGSSFDNSRDFPRTDFVATMPGLSVPAGPSPGSGLLGSNFGVTLTPGNTGAAKDFFAPPRHLVSIAKPKTKDPDAILHPFTHSIGTGSVMTTGLGPNQ